MRKIVGASAVLLLISAVGYTQAPEPRTGPSTPVQVMNTTANPVPVRGSLSISAPAQVQQSGPWIVTAEETFAPGRQPKRFGPVLVTLGPIVEVIPPVADGQTFILTYLAAGAHSSNSGIPLTRGGCALLLTSGNSGTPVLNLNLVPIFASDQIGDHQQLFLPLAAGEGLEASCSATAADGSFPPSQRTRITAAGYFVPASQ